MLSRVAWLMQWWTFVATALVVFVPGLAAAWAIGLRLRGLGAWAFAPVGSVAMIAVLAVAYGILHIPWTIVSAVLGLAIMAGMLVAGRFLLRIAPVRPRVTGARWPVALALTVAAALLTVRIAVYIGDPSNFSQTTDAIFHLGAVRAILESGDASSWGLAAQVGPDVPVGFYPGAWHGVASLVALLTGDIVVSTNILALVVAVVVWPLGITWLTQVALRRRVAAAAAVAMTPVIAIFPLTLLQFGVLYPYLLAVALLPASIAAVVMAGRTSALVLACGTGAIALALAHPSVLLAWGLALWLYAAGRVAFGVRRRDDGRWWRIGALVAGLAVLAAVWLLLGRSVTAGMWRPAQSGAAALADILVGGWMKTPPAWWVSVLAVVGLVATVRRRAWRWLALGWVIFTLLAFVAGGVRNELVRVLVVGPWYSDPTRLAALVPVLMLPVAAAGVLLLVDAVAALTRRRRGARPAAVRTVAGPIAVGLLLCIAIAVVGAQPLVLRYNMKEKVRETASTYGVGAHSWLDRDESILLSRLADEVPPGVRVLSNPGTGAAFGRFLSGVDVYPPRRGVPENPDYTLLKARLHDAATDPAVCDAVGAMRAGFVLDFGVGDEGFGRFEEMPGFTGLAGVPGFELVDREGAASLWRISACS